MLVHTIERRPVIVRPVPSHYGKESVHHNDVLRHRAKARRLWRHVGRRLSAPHFAPAHRNARMDSSED
jgi:hypothetical protein